MTHDEARAQFPVLERYAYLNAGSNGPLPQAAVDAFRARLERDELRRGAEHGGDLAANSLPQLDHLLDVRLAAPTRCLVALEPRSERIDGRLREWAVRAGV